MAEDPEPTDLLGEPLRPLPDKRGRRKLRFHAEVYEKVEVLAAGGMHQDDIADAVGISAPTLRKYFRPELGKGPARQRAMVLGALATQAQKGNVSAAKAYLAEIDKHGAADALKQRERPSPRPTAVRKGKKEERQDAAASVASAGGKYAPPAAPKLFN
jgi:AraC-like DNA-binding protein